MSDVAGSVARCTAHDACAVATPAASLATDALAVPCVHETRSAAINAVDRAVRAAFFAWTFCHCLPRVSEALRRQFNQGCNELEQASGYRHADRCPVRS